MASWGRGADVALTGTGEIAGGDDTVVGTGTAFTTELENGNLITLGGTDNFIVVSIANNTHMTVEPVASANVAALTAMTGSEAPKYLPVSEVDNITYVETGDIDANTRADGIKTPGWTLYEEYGTGRKRVETLVAMKTTS